jgi:hypothetical protein
MERGEGHVSARAGTYELKIDIKNTHRRIPCLRFNHLGAHTLLIHDAYNDKHKNLEGCIAPGLSSYDGGVHNSAEAMKEIFELLCGLTPGALTGMDMEALTKSLQSGGVGDFKLGTLFEITVENNEPGVKGDKDSWLKARVKAGKW